MTVTLMKTYFQGLDPTGINYYRDYKKFHNDLFRSDVHSKFGTLPNSCNVTFFYISFDTLLETVNQHVPQKHLFVETITLL